MSTINDRIAQVRESVGETQAGFAARIGLSRSSVTNIEAARYNVTNRVIDDIAREYSVNPEWLRTGEGEMFRTASPDAELMKMFGHLFADDAPKAAKLKKKLIRELLKLDDQQFESAMNFAKRLTEDDEE